MGTNFGNAFFNPTTKRYESQTMPVWIEVKGRKLAGGTFDISGFKDGDIIPAGIPVRLDLMGGTVKLLPTFEVVSAVASDGTSLVLRPLAGIVPAEDMVVGKMTDASTGKSIALGAATPGTGDNAGTYTFTITANSLGTLAAGDILVVVSAAGSNKAAVLPNGLSWRQVVIDSDDPTLGTIAVVTKGQVLADRIPQMPDFYKNALPGIDFEYERIAE